MSRYFISLLKERDFCSNFPTLTNVFFYLHSIYFFLINFYFFCRVKYFFYIISFKRFYFTYGSKHLHTLIIIITINIKTCIPSQEAHISIICKCYVHCKTATRRDKDREIMSQQLKRETITSTKYSPNIMPHFIFSSHLTPKEINKTVTRFIIIQTETI